MGGSSSHDLEHSADTRRAHHGRPEFYNHMHDYAYRGAAEKCGADFSGGYAGGCGCERGDFVGADELDVSTVREYTDSINSKAKNQIIDDLVQSAINLGMKITGSTPQEKIKSMLELLPTGDRIKAADDTHKKLCGALARAINNAHGNEIIGKDMPPEVVCQQVAEIVSSLSAGMHTEFLAVYNDVRKVLKNLQVLKEALKDDHEAIVLRIKQSDDALLPQQLTTLNDLHNILTEEVERQISMLSNLLNVTLFPTEKSLAALIKNKKDLHGYIDKINVKVGSEKFSKVISDILKGLGITANFALLIERALKTVGITLDEYAKGESIQKLREKITQGLMGKNLDETQLHEYLEAAELLYRNFYRNQDIAKTLEAHKTGSNEMEFFGGDDLYAKSTMDKRIADRTKVRTLIFTTFYRQLQGLFDQMVNAIDSLTMKVGAEIPLSDQLNAFRHILQRIDEGLVRNKNIYYALIGYYNDAMSRSKKDALVADLNMVSSYIDTLLEMPLYASSKQHFLAIQGQIKAIITLIDRFSDEIAAKFGRGEECAYLDDEKEGAYEFSDAVYGGVDSLESLEVEPKFLFKTTKSIHDAVRQFDYKYRVAQIRVNMAATGKELSHYSEKYEKIIANSIADILGDDKKTYEKLRKHLTEDSYFGKNEEYHVTNAQGFEKADGSATAKQRDAALKMLDAQWEAKKKFWATVEAVDTYMRVFTDSLVKNPQDIKEIKSMIDSIEVINDWYSEKTGNDLASVFDFFPSFMRENGGRGIVSNLAASVDNQEVVYPPARYQSGGEGSHYYSRLREQLNFATTTAGAIYNNPDAIQKSAYPGNPYLVTLPTYGEQARAQAKRTLSGLGVLKNLLSVFIHVGAKFGGEEIRKKVFMSPTQMYNNLIEYLHASAFAQGFGVGDFSAVGDNEYPEGFYNANDMAVEINMRTGEYISGAPRAAFGTAATYVRGSAIVHLGVTADATVSVVDHHYPGSTIGKALVAKINSATTNTFSALQGNAGLNGAAGVNITTLTPPGQVWASATTPTDKILLFKKRWGVWMRSILKGLKEREGFSFKREDDYFVLVLKSLAAKILTVVGMYDVLDRPMEFNGLSPIRMITGGAADTPKIEENAVALYLRLPLLAQFYRGIFGFENPQNETNTFQPYKDWRAPIDDRTLKISMVPDIDGTFAGLIRLVFRKNKFITGNNYSDEDLKELIREVNLIYQRMQSKYPQNTVIETIHEFVAEINRRYGIVSQSERDKYVQEFGQRYDYATMSTDRLNPIDRYTTPPETDIAILPGEDEEEVVRPSAAQRLLGETFETTSEKKRSFTITQHHKDLVYRFRCAIDKYFENPEEEYTFNHAIKSTQLKLKREQNDENRFKLVASLVRGVDVYSKVDGMKYVLFHETVVGGLNLLSAVHSMLARFKRRMHILDLVTMENLIWNYLGENPGAKTLGDLMNTIITFLTDELGLADGGDVQILELVQKLFGHNEAKEWNGGHTDAGADSYVLKGGDGIIIDNGAGVAQMVDRWGAGGTFGMLDVAPGIHVAFEDKTTGHHVLTNDVAAIGNNPKANTQGGLISILGGFSVEQLREARRNPNSRNKKARQAADTFLRFIFGREHVMRELLESLFGFSHDFQGLVDVKIEDRKLFVSFGGLKSLIEDMFQSVSYFMDLLRPHIQPAIMEKYTDKFVPGSYYWLQEQLIEKILVGRPPQPNALPGDTKRTGYASIDELMQRVTLSYAHLTREWDVNGAGLRPGNAQATISEVKSRNSFDKVFADLIFYDASKPSSGLIKSSSAGLANARHGAEKGLQIVDFMRDPYESLHFAGPMGAKVLDTRFAARFYQLYSWKDEFTFNRSVLFAFNQLVAKFIQNFYDPVSGKIYSGVLNQFANGSFNRAVADQLYTYPDTAPLWFVKYVGAGDTKIPQTVPLMASIVDPQNQEYVGLLKDLIAQYLKIGLAPGDHLPQNAAKRNGLLLKITNPEIAGLAPALARNAGAANNTPKIYVYLVMYAIGKVIEELFKINDVAGMTAADAIGHVATYSQLAADVMNLRVPGVVATTYGATRQLYSGDVNRSPSFTEIMQVLLGGGLDGIVAPPAAANIGIIARLQTLIIDHNNIAAAGLPFSMPAPASSLGLLLGAANVALAPQPAYQVMQTIKYKFLIRDVLRLPQTFPGANNFGSLILAATRIFPLQDDAVGRNDDELNYRADLFSTILIACRIAHGAAGGNQATFNNSLRDISSQATTVRSTYTGPLTAQPKHIIKQDDLFAVNDKDWVNNNLFAPIGDSNYLMLARSTGVSNALVDDNISKFPGQVGNKTNPTSDTLAAIQEFGRRVDPDADHILFTSLAVVLRNLTTSRNTQTQSLVFIQDNVADIALYMKERMRANLPAFRNLFKELITKCEFLKKFMGRPEMDLTRSYAMVGSRDSGVFVPAAAPAHNPWPYNLAKLTTTSAETKNRFVGILDSVIRGCSSLVTSCEHVLREIGDDPKYFELYQNSIKEYKTQYNVDPLMPLSSTLAVLKNVDNTNSLDFFPVHSLGQEQFKFMYGTRSLLGQPTTQPLAEHIPGFTQIVDGFNMIIDSKLQADKSKAESFMKTFVKMLRYVHELKHVKGVLTPYILTSGAAHPNALPVGHKLLFVDGSFIRDDLVLSNKKRNDGADRNNAVGATASTPRYGIHGTVIAGAENYDGPIVITNRSDVSLVDDGKNKDRKDIPKVNRQYAAPAYSVSKGLTDTIKLTESSFKEDKIKELVEHLCDHGRSRNTLEVQNIIDLNIVPINVHALMREIPLANLYNYAYTFDRLIIELYYGLQNANARKLISELCDYEGGSTNRLQNITSAKDMLVALLLNPYMDLFAPENPGPMRDTDNPTRPYDTFAKAMLAGAVNNGELGRPKFLSDQIFNKAVFGEVYADRSEYNEMGPAAAQTLRNKLTEQDGITLIAEVARMTLTAMNSARRFQATIMQVAPNQANLLNFCAAIAKYVAQNPTVPLDTLQALVHDKFLNPAGPNVPEFKRLQSVAGPDDAARARQLALFASLVVKLVYAPIALMVNEINQKGFDIVILEDYATAITLCLAVLDGVDRRPGGAYLGLAINNNAGGAAPADPTAAAAAYLRTLQQIVGFSGANAAGLDGLFGADMQQFFDIANRAWNSNPIVDNKWDNILPRIMAGVVYASPISIAKATVQNVVIPKASELSILLRGAMARLAKPNTSSISHNPAYTGTNSMASLHWLDIHEVKAKDFDMKGVGLQLKPTGDNENVLDDHQVHSVDVSAIRNVLADVGRLRFDTVFIRNLIFIINLYRSIRMKLQRDLVYSKDIILKAEPVTRAQLTEFYGNQSDASNRRVNYIGSPMWKRYEY